ncbi:MAG: hypothetical protein AVDCRST_MAG08-4035 [uncultured Acetobacteraceae bacterium]|uniref:Uncharacterized protein n=1 Tax=uncultured Acetobacteraceae bacterium TaxID=169975 RepID=A0A6J4JP74_9PROT|nr:MAG: hypothetical protein AVDCRST_MAG08-4035 [uncultured Acetobacteraceae bacterium]
MRRTMMAAVAAVLTAMGGAAAAPAVAPLDVGRHAAEPAQYYPAPYGYGDFEERRHYRRQLRRAHEEERIAEAARREAWRIERERAERRAWRHAQRERHGYYRGF